MNNVIYLDEYWDFNERPYVVETLDGRELYEADTMESARFAAAHAFQEFGCRKVNVRARHSGKVTEFSILP